MLKALLKEEGLRRQTEANKSEMDNMVAETIVAKIHAAFLAEKEALRSLEFNGDYGRAVSFVDAQASRGRRNGDKDFAESCLTPRGLSVRLGARLYPVDLELLVEAGDGGKLTIAYRRGYPHKDGVEATFDLHAPIAEVMVKFFSCLVTNVRNA